RSSRLIPSTADLGRAARRRALAFPCALSGEPPLRSIPPRLGAIRPCGGDEDGQPAQAPRANHHRFRADSRDRLSSRRTVACSPCRRADEGRRISLLGLLRDDLVFDFLVRRLRDDFSRDELILPRIRPTVDDLL